jgi:hypothetical protein
MQRRIEKSLIIPDVALSVQENLVLMYIAPSELDNESFKQKRMAYARLIQFSSDM